jgi:hypothetical protein
MEQGADSLLTVKANQRTLHRQISEQFPYSHKILFTATVSERGHGRGTTWMLRANHARKSKPDQQQSTASPWPPANQTPD